jgi:murein DD-endopeptidase MepM/ murein hydrolase activator NlpD
MNIKWYSKKLTFLIVPDVRGSVVRLQVPYVILYTALAVIVSCLVSVAVIYTVHSQALLETQALKKELIGKTTQYTKSISGKETTIEKLQNQVILLSQQANDVMQQVEEMKKLEKDVREISKLGKSTSSKKVAIQSAKGSVNSKEGMGGDMIPVTEEEITQLSKDIQTTFTSLTAQMEDLKLSLSKVKQEVLKQQRLLRELPNIWPADSRKVTSLFGYRKDPFTRRPTFHAGIDISDSTGVPIYATADGVVLEASYDKGKGNHVLLDHTKGIRTMYMHMNKLNVKSGASVKKGDIIGSLGSTGRSTGPHLHYEVFKYGVQVDPRPYLPEN